MTDTPLFQYTLRLADTALILGHRLSEWVGHSPVIEEDLAFGNMGLDLIGRHPGEIIPGFVEFANMVETKPHMAVQRVARLGRAIDALALAIGTLA